MSGWENIYAAGEQINRYPYSEIVSFVKRRWRSAAPDGAAALDIGCGAGVHAAFLAHEGADVVAFDASPSAIAHARSLHGGPNISYQVAGFAQFDPAGARFDLAVDRLSSTYATVDVVAAFYQKLRGALAPKAQLFWQGFDPDNTGRSLGTYDAQAGLWTGFTSGVFQPFDTITFFTEADLDRIFDGYTMTSKRITADTDLRSQYRHSFWTLELCVE